MGVVAGASPEAPDSPAVRVIAGVDIGNSTTEASLALIGDDGSPTFVGGALTPTTGVKGTPANVEGVVRVLRTALREARIPPSDLHRVLLNEATPVISGLAMETITETVITESTMIGHDPRTPSGSGIGVGITTAIDGLDDVDEAMSVVVVVPRGADFDDTARRIQAARDRGVDVTAAVLGNDDAVLVTNRLSAPLPVVDEVTRIDELPLGMTAAVEVADPGRTIRTLSNAYGLATIFDLDADETRAVAPVARALTGNRSVVVVRTPAGEVTDRTLPAGRLRFSSDGRSVTVDVSEGAKAIMTALARAQPLDDATGEPGTNVGGMMAGVRESMADLSGLPLDEVRVQDLLAVDTFVPVEVRGGLAGEISPENAVALAAMVRTGRSSMQLVADATTAALRRIGAADVRTEVGGIEAEMAVLGALTTPGTDRPIVVLDLGGGSTDAAVAEVGGSVRTTHLAGAGDLVTRLIASELSLDDDEVAEQVKRYPLAKVESFFHVRLEDGTTRFYSDPLPPTTFARVVTLGPDSLAPVATRYSVDRVRQVRRDAKERVFVVNALRALAQVAPHGDLRQIGFVVLLGGCALDFEIPEMLAGALAPFGIVCGTGNVRGTEGPRNAVASGLVAANAGRVAAREDVDA